jgi:hypothetical protein
MTQLQTLPNMQPSAQGLLQGGWQNSGVVSIKCRLALSVLQLQVQSVILCILCTFR